jgi:MYXO-CTERM domain-containing protein
VSRRRAFAAAVVILAAVPAQAYVRATTVNSDPASGSCLWWGARPHTLHVNATSAAAPPLRPACPTCAPCQDATAAAALVAGTLASWGSATRAGEGQPCTDLALVSGSATTQVAMGNDGVNLVVFRTGWCGSITVVPQNDPCRSALGACAAKYNCWEHDASGTIGLTTLTFRTGTGELLDADIELHGWDGNTTSPNGFYLTCATSPACSASPWGPPAETGCVAVDVASIALHEAGHVVGLDHTCRYAAPYDSCTPGSVMQPTITSGATRRTLDADDVAGICTIYPRGGATLTCGSSAGPPAGGGCGCGAGEGNGALALVAGVLAVLRARRRRAGGGPGSPARGR